MLLDCDKIKKTIEPHLKHNCNFNYTTRITPLPTTTTCNKDPFTALRSSAGVFAIGNLLERLAYLHLNGKVIFWEKLLEDFHFLLTVLQGVHGLPSGLSFCHWTSIHIWFLKKTLKCTLESIKIIKYGIILEGFFSLTEIFFHIIYQNLQN